MSDFFVVVFVWEWVVVEEFLEGGEFGECLEEVVVWF